MIFNCRPGPDTSCNGAKVKKFLLFLASHDITIDHSINSLLHCSFFLQMKTILQTPDMDFRRCIFSSKFSLKNELFQRGWSKCGLYFLFVLFFLSACFFHLIFFFEFGLFWCGRRKCDQCNSVNAGEVMRRQKPDEDNRAHSIWIPHITKQV